MPAKVYYEPSRRFGTRNVLTENTGMDLLGGCWGGGGGGGGLVHPLALAIGGAERGAIFHDKAKNY